MTLSPDAPPIPPAILPLVTACATLPGAVAVALGGSRASGDADATSDWDLAIYYRGALDHRALATWGEIHPPGSWGRLMNGGAWLTVAGASVDLILRDVDVVAHWTAQAAHGTWELDALLGYVAGLPTYSLAAELATGRVIAGALPPEATGGPMPAALRATAPLRWRFMRDFSLEYARMHAARGNVAGAMGCVVQAAMQEAHARTCAAGRWTLNEKRLLDAAGLTAAHAVLARPLDGPGGLERWIAHATALLTSA